MSTIVVPPLTKSETITPGPGALLSYLQQKGKLPPVTLSIFPLEGGVGVIPQKEIFVDKFLSYKFQSSILIPVDTFSARINYEPIEGFRKPSEGDIFVLRANGQPVSTGIVDQLDMETDASQGTTLDITGRDLLGQFEDQDAVSLDSKMIYGNSMTPSQVVRALAQDTRIDPAKVLTTSLTSKAWLFATQPGETKLSALQRYCEPLDIYFWMNGDGRVIIGKPDVKGVLGRRGSLILSKKKRSSNVLKMRSTRNSTQIPNIFLGIWNAQETVQSIISGEQILNNTARGPSRLRTFGHRLPKAIVTSTPQGSAPQDLSDVNALEVARQNLALQKKTKAGQANLLQAYAKREMAKANIRELQVQVQVIGPYNENALPFQADQTYRIVYDVDDIDQDMYLYQVEYSLDDKNGQITTLLFCTQDSIVADPRAL